MLPALRIRRYRSDCRTGGRKRKQEPARRTGRPAGSGPGKRRRSGRRLLGRRGGPGGRRSGIRSGRRRTCGRKRRRGSRFETVDYSGKNKEQLLAIFETLLRTKPVQTIRADVEAIKIAFYKNYRNEVDQLRKLFVESGGNSEDFVPPANEAEQQFKTLFAEYREKRNEFIARLDAEKRSQLPDQTQIIEELKELVNSNETLNQTFNTFRELQQRWKETGLVQQSVMKDLWETYNLHVENFYNFIKINKELRDLDLKKENYEAKIALCEEAEALVLENSVITAFHKLQKLQ